MIQDQALVASKNILIETENRFEVDSIAVSVFADIFIELTNTEMAATTLWALEWMWETIQKWSWDWTEDLAKNRAGFVKNSAGFLAIIQLVFATANLD